MATKKLSNDFIMAILYVVIGALLCIFRAEVLSWIMTAAGVLFVVAGVIDIVKYKNKTGGIINIAIGVVILVAGWLLLELALIIFGVLIVINGVKELLEVKKSKNIMPYVAPIVTIVVGALLVVAQWIVFDWFFIAIGVIFIVNGVLALLGKK